MYLKNLYNVQYQDEEENYIYPVRHHRKLAHNSIPQKLKSCDHFCI